MPTDPKQISRQDAPYAGASFALLTKHGKERAITPRFAAALGATIAVTDAFDTDTLGTFTREIPRFGNQLDAARKKAELAIKLTGCPLGLGSEGSFIPGPFGLGSLNLEVITLVDRHRNLVITGAVRQPGHHASGTFETWDALAAFAGKAKFPTHALVLRPDDENHPHIRKGLTDHGALRAAYDECLALAKAGAVFAESDLRAHLNPTRTENIGAACDDLIARMMRACPACDAPGFGLARLESGLPCSWCGEPTNDWKAEEFHCVACPHIESKPRTDRHKADPGFCPHCNP
ncbi:MAG: hypothetical protein FGM15_10575 [Chthoniobacterales bacterium]|nr:hypothetical protein [Chthoniobacterales bacterium]